VLRESGQANALAHALQCVGFVSPGPTAARMPLTRRSFAIAASAALAAPALRAATPRGALVFAQSSEPQSLTNALSTEGNIYTISSKLFDGLLGFDANNRPVPRLATGWDVSPDGLTVTLDLRSGVKWHDGQPLVSGDVAFSLLDLWSKYNARGRTTFATVERVETPTAQRAVLKLARPAPYLISALSSIEAQVLPRHLYAGSNPLTNPRNQSPVGSGPFRFVQRQRGSHITLERNPDYWDKGKPLLDKLVFRFVPDGSSAAAALEAGEVHLALSPTVPLADIPRLRNDPRFVVTEFDEPITAGLSAFEFNLDRPVLRDVRVRRAFAHALDRSFIVRNVFRGYAFPAESAIPSTMPEFFTDDVPKYAFDPKKAEALLEEAGLKRDAKGVRLTLHCDPNPNGELVQVAQYARSALARIGVKLEVRLQDFPEYVNRLYTRRDWDTALVGGSMGPDPAIGTQRWYWSKNFKPGVAFSNGAHYENPEVDAVLEAAQIELDPAKRRVLYHRFQRLVGTDLPRIPLFASKRVVVSRREVQDFINSAEGLYGNFADATLRSL
jgi:peptide/nickel transport system substrate-binding protein